jgi:hypothetical protein
MRTGPTTEAVGPVREQPPGGDGCVLPGSRGRDLGQKGTSDELGGVGRQTESDA